MGSTCEPRTSGVWRCHGDAAGESKRLTPSETPSSLPTPSNSVHVCFLALLDKPWGFYFLELLVTCYLASYGKSKKNIVVLSSGLGCERTQEDGLVMLNLMCGMFFPSQAHSTPGP